jgi:simple sugar transport system ATP-binding protein
VNGTGGQAAGDGPALTLTAISKRFGSTQALRNVSLQVRRGTVHALLGENGAGKSTLVRAAFGLITIDSGTVVGGNPPRVITSPDAAMAAGIGMVHQHFTNVPSMTVAENVVLGGRGAFHARTAAAKVREIGDRTGLWLDPNARAGSLPVGAQQRLEIVKALARDATMLLLDEPTAVLVPTETAELLSWLRDFANRGGSVVLITHRLREALAIADDVTVLRGGAVVLTERAASVDERSLAGALLGEEPRGDGETSRKRIAVGDEGNEATNGSRNSGDTVARLTRVVVKDDRGVIVVDEATLAVRAAEILGVAAVEGSGQHALLRVLAARTSVTIGTAELPANIGFVPEDRQGDGLVLEFSLDENLMLRGAGRRTGRIRWREQHAIAEEALRTFDVRAHSISEHADALSGGNQQKLVLARELSDNPTLLVVENPTRGLDIRATRDVHTRLRNAAASGTAVVLHSSDLDEVLRLSDRVVVMHAGRLRAVENDRDAVGRAMLGVA